MIPGAVRVSVTGRQGERFLNLCRGRNIEMKKIIRFREDQLLMTIPAEDFFRLSPMRRKTGVQIHILKKTGPLFFLLTIKRHRAVPAGILVVLGVLFFLSGRIWNVRILGNTLTSDPQLICFLREQGVTWGVSRKSVSCKALGEALRRRFPGITWASAGFSGTELRLEVREGKTGQENRTPDTGCSLVADTDGIITSMVTRAGTPVAEEGEKVKKGQELVSGILEFTDDSQEVIRYEYVHADADIYITHQLAYYASFPLTAEKKVMYGKEKKSFFFRLGPFLADFSFSPGKNELWWAEEKFPGSSDSFRLPFSGGTITAVRYRTKEQKLTEEEAKKQAISGLYNYEEKLIEKGVQISENNVKIEINHQDCVSRGSLTVTEKAVREVPTEKKTQPKERTPEDG